jgi:rare lipoprotein A
MMYCKHSRVLVPALAVLLLLLGGCGTKSWRTGGVAGSKPYTIRGKTYYPLQSARGFIEEGIASWYGPGFHGKRTANGEIYDMHAMTAAHKILPLGTIVRVTNKHNGRSLVLRINDRGPFADDRVIDLSRAAADKLDVLSRGTAPVRITVFDDQVQTASATAKADDQPPKLNSGRGGRIFLQVGAFPHKEDAQEMARQMENLGYKGRFLYADSVKRWRVQLGPVASRDMAEDMKQRLIDVAHDAFVVIDD